MTYQFRPEECPGGYECRHDDELLRLRKDLQEAKNVINFMANELPNLKLLVDKAFKEYENEIQKLKDELTAEQAEHQRGRTELAAERAAVIEECAKVADDECERVAGINADRYWQSRRIRDAIRALAKGGGDE